MLEKNRFQGRYPTIGCGIGAVMGLAAGAVNGEITLLTGFAMAMGAFIGLTIDVGRPLRERRLGFILVLGLAVASLIVWMHGLKVLK